MNAEPSAVLLAYFAATNAHDIMAMSAAFTDDAVVNDEGGRHEGRDAIRTWMRATIDEYDYAVDPREWSRTDVGAIVVVSVRGKFPGSPIELRYDFRLQGEKIERLEIS